MKISLTQFDKGLALGPPADQIAEGYLRRARGMHPLSYGSFRSRLGSSLLTALNAHSIFYFANIYYYGVTTTLYRATAPIKYSLSGARLSFSKMPPVAGIVDYLFCVGGGDLFKVDSSGNVTDWGFAAPASAPSAAPAAGGSLVDGVYSYQITYYNNTTGHRSNGNGTSVTATASGTDNSVALTSIPDPTAIDTQITHVEIWRSVENGDALFFLARITAGTTSYTDTGAVTLSSEELPTDNLQPYSYFDDCLGPHNASMFWITRTEAGQRGRVFYSAIGRAEGLSGFINVCSDDAPLQRLFRFQGQLGVIGEAGIYLIGGTLPYIAREVSGCPGTTKPHTVVVVPNIGVVYEANDGIRIFDGTNSAIATPGAVDRLFNGDSIGDLTSFTGEIATFAKNGYIISDITQTLALDVINKKWRDIGVGCNALFYNTETNVLAATISNNVLSLEGEGTVTDNGTAIPFSLEPRHISFDDERDRLLQHITIDINCASQSITAILIHDSTETTIGVLSVATRTKITIPIGITAKQFGIRFTASLSNAIELHRIDFIFNDPIAEAQSAA